jgi:adenylosuccinate synthase
LIGSGVVVHVPAFFKELNDLKTKGLDVGENKLFISDRAHVVFDLHQLVDGLEEIELAKGGEKKAIGTTRKGIGVRKRKKSQLDQDMLTQVSTASVFHQSYPKRRSHIRDLQQAALRRETTGVGAWVQKEIW